MARTEHRYCSTRPELAALLLLSPKSIPTMNLLPGTGTAGGSTLSKQKPREGGGGGCKAEAASLLSSLLYTKDFL